MLSKFSLLFLIAILFLITYSIFIRTLLLRNTTIFPPPPNGRQCVTRQPLRVYMYDLPRKFNVGMFDVLNTDQDAVPVTAENFPPFPTSSSLPVRMQSMEYWLMASLFYEGGAGDERETVRVVDPEKADVFFVPVFSALSFYALKHKLRKTSPSSIFYGKNNFRRTYQMIEKELQVELLEFLRRSKYWDRNKGRDHVIPLTLPSTFDFLRQELNESIFFVVDFGNYPKTTSNLRKDVVSPYVHLVEPFLDDDPPNPFESRTTLLFFRGYTKRKNEGKIRMLLMEAFAGYDDVRYESGFKTKPSVMEFAKGMQSSKFCLSLVGDTPSSCRLFDAIVSHCVPVIVSDHIELPYEDELDYSKFSIFFSMEEALQPSIMVNQLRRFTKAKWMEMWRRLKKISHHFEFQYPPKKDDAVNLLWKQVKHKLPRVQLAMHRSSRLQIYQTSGDGWILTKAHQEGDHDATKGVKNASSLQQ